MKIVIVESNHTQLTGLRFALEEEGHHVSITSDGAGSLLLIEQIQPSLIILDMQTPGLDALFVCSELRKAQGGSKPTIILFSAHTKLLDITAGYQAGADYYVQKDDAEGTTRLHRIAVSLAHQQERLNFRTTTPQLPHGHGVFRIR